MLTYLEDEVSDEWDPQSTDNDVDLGWCDGALDEHI